MISAMVQIVHCRQAAERFGLGQHCTVEAWSSQDGMQQGSQKRGTHVTHDGVLCGLRCSLGI